ncbi:MAG: hypothetical protein HQ472_02375 [Ignavibacteria bacterium]|nr:hypothetical protein [Ignavibacteria bacterium]
MRANLLQAYIDITIPKVTHCSIMLQPIAVHFAPFTKFHSKLVAQIADSYSNSISKCFSTYWTIAILRPFDSTKRT